MNWEITGNHYMALPSIDPTDGAVHEVNALHRGLASLVSWTGSRSPGSGTTPLLRIGVSVDGQAISFQALRWERLDRWIPRLSVRTADGTRVVITYCAPGGFDPLAAGGVIGVHVENGGRDAPVRVWIDGVWAWTLRSMASTRPSRASRCLCAMSPGVIVMESGEIPAGIALAVRADGPEPFTSWIDDDGRAGDAAAGEERCEPNGRALGFRIGSERRLGPGKKAMFSFTLGVAQERDGAVAAAGRLAMLGADELVRRARLDLASLNRATDDSIARDLVARNLVFHHYWAAGRAVDDDRLYPLLSRSPEHGSCAVFAERESLAWSLPAYAITDSMVAREILMRVLELYSDRPGNFQRYIDGAVLDSGYSLGRSCEYVLAIESYIDQARDGAFADEPLVQQVFREIEELAWSRVHQDTFLASTEILSGGEPADYPWCAFDNVLLWKASRVLERFRRPDPGEARPRLANAAAEIEAAFWQRFVTEVNGLPVIGYTTDLRGHAAIYDDPSGSLRLLPWLGFCAADDPIWVNTMELLHSPEYPLWLGGHRHPGLAGRSRPGAGRFSALCADLLTGRRAEAIDRLRSLDLPGGVACTSWNPESGRMASGPWAACEAGLLVWAMLAGETR
jgi:uncharacterized protein